MKFSGTFTSLIFTLTTHLALAIAQGQQFPVKDGCPKGSLECMDVINSSQCIEQLIIEKRGTLSKEALEKCVVYEGASSSEAGNVKV